MNVLKRHDYALVGRYVNPGDTGHSVTPVAGRNLPTGLPRFQTRKEASQTLTRRHALISGPGIVRNFSKLDAGY
jgi:hypothetical protein